LIHERIFTDVLFLFKLEQEGIRVGTGPVELGLVKILFPLLWLVGLSVILWSMGAAFSAI